MDRHIWDVLPVHFVNIAFVGWLAQMLFLISTCSTKVSVLLFYRRLTQGTYSKSWKVCQQAVLFLVSKLMLV